ncbi:MAG: hypothetical protein LUO93_05950 [Methanomicrobiales archaeon]|nr:hypothetical protein [Methanomicrobiales archaeon]
MATIVGWVDPDELARITRLLERGALLGVGVDCYGILPADELLDAAFIWTTRQPNMIKVKISVEKLEGGKL